VELTYGCHHGDPEVVAAGAPDIHTVAQHVRGEAGAEVAGEVDGVAGFPSKASSDAEAI
jgi:hypothetical protein